MAQKLSCVVENIIDHGDHVYTLALRLERPAPRFRAGQFLHLALDPYDPSGFWPEPRVFSLASPPAPRGLVLIPFAVPGGGPPRPASERGGGQGDRVRLPLV